MSLRPLVLLSLILASGCATKSKLSEPPRDSQVLSQLNSLEGEVHRLREQNIVLSTELKRNKKSADPAESKSAEPVFSNEHSLYNAALEAYWTHDLAKLKRLNSMFQKAFPHSVHADNVLYLTAATHMNSGELPEALKILNALIDKYPNSSKVVSAEFMKVIIYNKLNIPETANEISRRILKEYPGSVEAVQARQQLAVQKLLQREVSRK